MKRFFLILGLVPLVAGAPALAEECTKGKAATPPAASTKAPAKPPAGGAGLIAFVDPATGKLVEPSAADMEALRQSPELQRSLNKSFEGLTEVRLPGGRGYLVDLQGRFQSLLVATVGPDGKLRVGHPTTAAPVPPEAVPAAKAQKEGDRK